MEKRELEEKTKKIQKEGLKSTINDEFRREKEKRKKKGWNCGR